MSIPPALYLLHLPTYFHALTHRPALPYGSPIFVGNTAIPLALCLGLLLPGVSSTSTHSLSAIDGKHATGRLESELGMARLYGHECSENNMGFGEGRALYMVDLMEQAPEQSLFVLEEPETSLHEEAQHRLARYFLDVCNRRHHQIVLSTHSHSILEALPSEARQLLHRDASGVAVFPGISSTRARAILSGGATKALTVCVEDGFAKVVLTEILRREDPNLLKAIRIEPLGSRDAVRQGVPLLKRLDQPVVGFRDGDVGAAPAKGLYSLPGNHPPEREVYSNGRVQERFYHSLDLDLFEFLSKLGDVDHHRITGLLADELSASTGYIETVAAQVYAEGLDHTVRQKITQTISEAM